MHSHWAASLASQQLCPAPRAGDQRKHRRPGTRAFPEPGTTYEEREAAKLPQRQATPAGAAAAGCGEACGRSRRAPPRSDLGLGF